MEKTLYLTDLDGTLLRSHQKVSLFTAQTISRLVEQGMLFSYATARSFVTAEPLTRESWGRIPVIVYNGALIVDHQTHEILHSHVFSSQQVEEIYSQLMHSAVFPIVYGHIGGREVFCYCPTQINEATRVFLDTRKGDVRDTPVEHPKDLCRGNPFYFTCIGEEEKLYPLYQRFRQRYSCVYQKDIYSGEMWLEIMPKGCTKASSARKLKEWLGCQRLVVFGDGANDIPLFQVADEAYAVENGMDALKEIATGVIASNNADGVAKFLLTHFSG